MSFFIEVMGEILGGSGFAAIPTDWRQLVMIIVACVLLYMGIGKGYEPLLLLPIAFGMLLANLPVANLNSYSEGSLIYYLYKGVKLGIRSEEHTSELQSR